MGRGELRDCPREKELEQRTTRQDPKQDPSWTCLRSSEKAEARSSRAWRPWKGLWVLSSKRREASRGLRRRLDRSEICLDKVSLAAVWRMDYKGVENGNKKSQMGQRRNM